MKGFKLLDEGYINEYGHVYEFNKKYHLNGELRWNYNGFHFCTHIEDTLRYRNRETNTFVIVEVEASGEIVDGSSVENDYYGYESGYASSEIEIIREVPREEMINMVINTNNINRVNRLIVSIPLTEEEINLIMERYANKGNVRQYIEYYQYGDEQAFYKKLM